MKKYLPYLALSSMLSLLSQTAGCAHQQPTLSQALNQAAAAATGPCAQGILATMAACKTQYPNIGW